MRISRLLRRSTLILILLSVQPLTGSSQTDPEFERGFITHAKLHDGMVTSFSSRPDVYVGGIQLVSQATVIPHLMRVGAVAGMVYTGKKMSGEFGPSVAVKLKTIHTHLGAAPLGSIGNIHLLIDHLWGTNRQRLLGGGIILDAGNLVTLGLTGHRDYKLNTWWLQTEIGVRISKRKRLPEI